MRAEAVLDAERSPMLVDLPGGKIPCSGLRSGLGSGAEDAYHASGLFEAGDSRTKASVSSEPFVDGLDCRFVGIPGAESLDSRCSLLLDAHDLLRRPYRFVPEPIDLAGQTRDVLPCDAEVVLPAASAERAVVSVEEGVGFVERGGSLGQATLCPRQLLSCSGER
jgi:hypothetical protein